MNPQERFDAELAVEMAALRLKEAEVACDKAHRILRQIKVAAGTPAATALIERAKVGGGTLVLPEIGEDTQSALDALCDESDYEGPNHQWFGPYRGEDHEWEIYLRPKK